jgi:heme/copper-type cytochrome/quinol oxidase subunit 2
MQHDTLSYDSLINRPLPKWLIDQKSGLTTIQPQKIVIKEDNSLKISFIVTSVFILLAVAILTFYFLKRHKKQI